MMCILQTLYRMTVCAVLLPLATKGLQFPSHEAVKEAVENVNVNDEGKSWSPWSDWSECSRSCGGGSCYRRRVCPSDFCEGSSVAYETCENQNCPDGSVDYRASQCSFFNNLRYFGNLYSWKPVVIRHSPCALYCTAHGTNITAKLAQQVLDGTKCRTGYNDMCINGECESVGCDKKLHSQARNDVCGKCQGDGSTCRLVTGLHRSNPVKHAGTEVVITIPQDSRRISVSERGSGHVGLLLRESNEFDIIVPRRQGNRSNGVLERSGIVVEFGAVPSGKEFLDVPGPVPSEMKILALYDDTMWKYIRYEFYRPLIVFWKHDESSSPCPVTCGAGMRFIRPICVEMATGERRDDKACHDEGITPPLPKVMRCKLPDCPDRFETRRIDSTFEFVQRNRWLSHPWTECSASCAGGFQSRAISCVEDNLLGYGMESIDDAACHRAHIPLPESNRRCNEHPCPDWIAYQWSQCSATCGPGWRHRTVQCESHEGTAAFNCNRTTKPTVRQMCFESMICPLPGSRLTTVTKEQMLAARVAQEVNLISTRPSWVSEAWGECSRSCGLGVSTREVVCKAVAESAGMLETLPDDQCIGNKPLSVQRCSMGECVFEETPHDIEGEDDTDDFEVVEDFSVFSRVIYNSPVPITEERLESFNPEDLLHFEWRYGDFSSCTPNCGSGFQTSQQHCYHKLTGAMVSETRCDVTIRLPNKTISCTNDDLCDVTVRNMTAGSRSRWELGPYGECTVTCGRGVQTRTVECRHMPEGPDQEHVTRGTPMPDMMCPAPKPEVAESCSLKACAPAWVAQPWGDCNRSCGRGQQTRELVCMQRLGTGETVRVPDIYCSRITPDTKRFCAMHNCPARYIVRPWSRCPPRCGTTYSTRQIACVQLRAGKLKPAMVDIKKCFKNRRPLTRKLCKKPGCPVIRKSKNANFVQTTNESKVRLQVGTTASVFPRTTVIVRCKVDRFRKQDLQWRFRGSVISNMGGHLSVLRDNSLRIVRAVKSDEGIYICAAGNVRAKFVLKIITNDTERGIPTTRSSMTTPIHRRQEIKTKIQGTIPIRHRTTPVKFIDNIDSSESDTTTATRFHFPRTVSMMPRQPPPPRIIVPSLSYVKQQAPIEIDARLSRMPSDSPAVPIHREVEHAEVDEIHDLNRIPKYSTNPPHFQGPISEEDRLLHEALSQHQLRLEIPDINILEQFQTALNEEEVDDIYLPMITDDDLGINRQRSGIRSVGNTAVVKAIGGLGERRENTRRPSIPSQPTVTPRQLAQEVTVYVGSSLIIVAGVTERITILCESNGDPVPVISWYRDNIRLPMENNRRQYVLEDGALRLLYPHTSDTGSYVCVASNRFGNDSRTTALTVTHKPRILSTTEDLEDFESELVEVDVGSNIQAKLGAKIRIRCPTEGFPEPYIRWTKDGPGLSTNSIIQTDNTLEIFPARKADQGLFSCEASNPAGSDYQVSSLILVEPPHISEILSERPEMAGMQGLPDLLVTSTETQLYKVKINGAVMMGCPVTGFPEPQLTWFFNDTPIYELGSTLDYQLIKKGTILQIPNANAITEGEYTCQAGNDGGNLTTSLRLSIVVYSYQFGENTPCTATCGDSGFQYRRLMCMEDGVKEVDEWYCTGVEKPTAVMTPCGRQDCPPRYLIRGWGSCSASCGNGTRSRILGCGILMSDGSTREVALELCGFNETRPVTTETCYAERCPRWHVGAWRRCSRKCIGRNMSARTRKVICVSGNGTTIGRKACKHLPKPRRRTLCPNPRCKPVWVASKWSVCSKPCGNDGIRTRILNCVYRGRKRQLAGAQCSKAQRPLVSIRCNRFPCRKDVHLPTPSNSPPCVNRFHKCRKIGRAGLCLYYKRFCCQTCS